MARVLNRLPPLPRPRLGPPADQGAQCPGPPHEVLDHAVGQARILRLLIERIDVAPDGISVTLHAAGIRSFVAELASQAEAGEGAVLEAAE
jgi:hypothetical protein